MGKLKKNVLKVERHTIDRTKIGMIEDFFTL